MRRVARDQDGSALAIDLREHLIRIDRGIAETEELRKEIRTFSNTTKAHWEPWKAALPALAVLSAWGAFLAFLFSHW